MSTRALVELPEPINEMTRRLVSEFRPDRIILFGSHARGTARPDSDADLLVVMPVDGSRRKRAVEMERLLAGVGMAKDLLLATPEELERYQDLPGTVIRCALEEGIVLYERGG